MVRMRLTILRVDAIRHTAFPLVPEVTATTGISCVYLTSSSRDAIKAWRLLAKFNIRMYWATSLADALSLVKTVGALVLLVDESFHGGTWHDAIREVLIQSSETAVVVAAPLWNASVWEHVVPAGGFDVVLKPLALEEVGPIVRNAAEFAREFLATSTRKARERALLTAIRRSSGQPLGSRPHQSSRAVKSLQLLDAAVSKSSRRIRLFLKRLLGR